GAFLLCRTSNPGGDDLQNQRLASIEGQPLLYEHLARLAQGPWNRNGQLGLVVGATYPQEIERVRSIAPTLPLLIPGVGAQGGDAVATVRAGLRPDGPIIVNSSRAILYASGGDDFAAAARHEALRTRATRPTTVETPAVLQCGETTRDQATHGNASPCQPRVQPTGMGSRDRGFGEPMHPLPAGPCS
ncbi:orotidine 5'-phosphate decarboxylase / HUMPS family protein, partial [Acidovorax sp. 16-64-162]|uniref:orotidine 5'-phosphate decarboxylase / HUMPS family protein n=1 Tax=Acidovorax sp. 16-64-162 TaxID=1970307 RepID=UPI0025BC3B58